MFTVEPTEIPDVKIVIVDRIKDHRGYFSETYSRRTFSENGIADEFVQDNQSHSAAVNTIRGLHFQTAPFAQAKLVRVLRGRILDVAVDLRRSSPTYGRHVAVELSSEDGRQLFIPIGFAHGFRTLEADTEIYYKVSACYSAEHDRGVLWNDPTLGISWNVESSEALLSDKDIRLPTFAELPTFFR